MPEQIRRERAGILGSVAEQDGKRERPAGSIGAVAHALELLRLFSASREIQVNQASRELGVSRSTVHRLLSTLLAYDFVRQDPVSRAYLPGPALMSIGAASLQNSDIRTVARDAMLRLAAATGETAHVMILRGDQVLCIDSIESTQTVRTGSRVGWTLPARSAASGKALLAELSDAELAAIFDSEVTAGPVSAKNVQRVDLLAELELVRARGYATNFGETEPDVSAVGVALRGRDGRVRAALSVTAPRTRGDEAWMREAGRQAVEIAEAFRGAID